MAPPYLIVAADCVKTGGMDRANYALADYLARRGREVHVVAHGMATSLTGYANLHWHRVPRPLGHDALGWSLLDRAGCRWARELAPRGVRVIVNGGNCRAAGACNWVHYVHAAYRAPTAGSPVRRAWQWAKHRRALADERRALRRAGVVIANSEHTRTELLQLALPPERVRTIYYGTDAALFGAITPAARTQARRELQWPAEAWIALFVGALGDRRKGFDTLFAAWQILCARADWDGVLAVAGQGAELEAGRRRVEAAGLGSRCRLLGFRTDVPRLLAASDVLVAPTRYEAYGLAVQEAWTRALPALVSAHAGVAERLGPDLEMLRLERPDSPEALAERLLWCRAHAAELAAPLEALGARLRARSWDMMAAEVVAACQARPAFAGGSAPDAFLRSAPLRPRKDRPSGAAGQSFPAATEWNLGGSPFLGLDLASAKSTRMSPRNEGRA